MNRHIQQAEILPVIWRLVRPVPLPVGLAPVIVRLKLLDAHVLDAVSQDLVRRAPDGVLREGDVAEHKLGALAAEEKRAQHGHEIPRALQMGEATEVE
jgi:hypothetical protein